MSKRKDNQKNYKYPKDNDDYNTSIKDKEKKIDKRKKKKKNEKITDLKSNDQFIEEPKEMDNGNIKLKNQENSIINEEKLNSIGNINKENINTNDIDIIEEDLLNYYIEEIKKTIEEDKKDKYIISTETEEKYSNEKNEKKKSKKEHSIDVAELQEIKLDSDNNSNIPIEVKNKIFNDINNIYKEITYDGKIFIEERHKTKEYPNIITYRCKNQRKNERTIHSYFFNAIVKRKIEKNTCFYILEKDHSEECNNLIIKKKMHLK